MGGTAGTELKGGIALQAAGQFAKNSEPGKDRAWSQDGEVHAGLVGLSSPFCFGLRQLRPNRSRPAKFSPSPFVTADANACCPPVGRTISFVSSLGPCRSGQDPTPFLFIPRRRVGLHR